MVIDVSIENPGHLAELLRVPGADGVFLPGDRIPADRWKKSVRDLHEAGKKAYLAFPYVFRTGTGRYYEAHREELREAGFDGWLVRSLDEAGFLEETALPGLRIFDAGMYAWNSSSIRTLRGLGADVLTLPCELRESELSALDYGDAELVAYGRLPVMVSAQCTAKNTGACRRGQRSGPSRIFEVPSFRTLRDRKGAGFVEDPRCRFCHSVIFNSVPLWLLDRIPENCERIRFSFTDEKIGEAGRLLRAFAEGNTAPEGSFTRGHFRRGVE